MRTVTKVRMGVIADGMEDVLTYLVKRTKKKVYQVVMEIMY